VHKVKALVSLVYAKLRYGVVYRKMKRIYTQYMESSLIDT